MYLCVPYVPMCTYKSQDMYVPIYLSFRLPVQDVYLHVPRYVPMNLSFRLPVQYMYLHVPRYVPMYLSFRLPVQDMSNVPLCRPEAVLESGEADRRNVQDRSEPAQETSCKFFNSIPTYYLGSADGYVAVNEKTASWPDFGIKSSPILSQGCPEISHSRFSKIAQSIDKYLGHYCKKIICQNLLI